jgi:hypothetical protein
MLSSSCAPFHGLRRGADSSIASSAQRREIFIVSTAGPPDIIAELAECLATTGGARELAEGLNVDLWLDDGRCLRWDHLRLSLVKARGVMKG